MKVLFIMVLLIFSSVHFKYIYENLWEDNLYKVTPKLPMYNEYGVEIDYKEYYQYFTQFSKYSENNQTEIMFFSKTNEINNISEYPIDNIIPLIQRIKNFKKFNDINLSVIISDERIENQDTDQYYI